MSQETPESISAAFRDAMNDLAGIHHVAVAGVRAWRQTLEPHLTDPVNPSADFLSGHGDPQTADAVGYQRWRIDTVLERLADDGPVARALGRQWAVMVASVWEHDFRPRLADAFGVSKSEIKNQLMADITYLRNDVVHHKGIATPRNAGRCQQLKWASSGEEINITTERVADFMQFLGLTFKP